MAYHHAWNDPQIVSNIPLPPVTSASTSIYQGSLPHLTRTSVLAKVMAGISSVTMFRSKQICIIGQDAISHYFQKSGYSSDNMNFWDVSTDTNESFLGLRLGQVLIL